MLKMKRKRKNKQRALLYLNENKIFFNLLYNITNTIEKNVYSYLTYN